MNLLGGASRGFDLVFRVEARRYPRLASFQRRVSQCTLFFGERVRGCRRTMAAADRELFFNTRGFIYAERAWAMALLPQCRVRARYLVGRN